MRRQQSPEQQRAPVGVTEQQSRRQPPAILAGRPLVASSPRTTGRGGGSLRRPAATATAAAVHPQRRQGRLGAPTASPRTAAAAAAAQRTARAPRPARGLQHAVVGRQPARTGQPARSESVFDVEPSERREQSTDNPISKDETHQMMTVAENQIPMEDIVANALAVDSEDTTRVEKVLARDSNAVQSTVFPEWKKIGALLANESGGPSLVCYALQGLCAATGILGVPTTLTLHDTHALSYIAGALWGLGPVGFSLCVTSGRVALMPGGQA
eukprot:COSAG02_NODE_5358_length_4399_cov_16.010930_2_plen_270_part_00